MKKLSILVGVLFAGIALHAQTINRDSLIANSFIQGKANNCASIALIKAAMLKYGYQHIFTYNHNIDGYSVILKDGTALNFSNDEFSDAKKRCKFNSSGRSKELGSEKDSVLFYAYLSYAVIVKFIQVKGYWGCEGKHGEPGPLLSPKNDFYTALTFLTDTSVCTDYCYRLLGLQIKDDKIVDFKTTDMLNDPGIILYSWEHAVVVYHNQVDCHGNWLPMNLANQCSEFQWYIELR